MLCWLGKAPWGLLGPCGAAVAGSSRGWLLGAGAHPAWSADTSGSEGSCLWADWAGTLLTSLWGHVQSKQSLRQTANCSSIFLPPAFTGLEWKLIPLQSALPSCSSGGTLICYHIPWCTASCLTVFSASLLKTFFFFPNASLTLAWHMFLL